MLPVPMVAASAVVSAPNWVMSPSALEGSSLVTDSLMPVPILRWMNPVRMVMKMCVPSSSKIMMGPHTKPSTASMTSSGLVAVAIPSASPVNGVMKNDVRKSSMAFPFPVGESACVQENRKRRSLPDAYSFLAYMTGKTLPKAVYGIVSNAITLVLRH